eukprot:scaffold28189_cov51-Cyclotella_meneghiniana.AAC.2
MESLLPQHSPFLTLAQSQDLIGFNFNNLLLVEPQRKLLIRIMEPVLASLNSRKGIIHGWSQELSQQLLLFIKQHSPLLAIRGKTVAEHELVLVHEKLLHGTTTADSGHSHQLHPSI